MYFVAVRSCALTTWRFSPEIILFNIKNATKEQSILPLISTIKTASLFFEYLNIPRTSTTTLKTSILPSMLQVGEYVYLWTHVRASGYTFGVFCVWISLYMLKCSFRHPFLAIIIHENLSCVGKWQRFVKIRFYQGWKDLQSDRLLCRIVWWSFWIKNTTLV